MDTGLTAIIGIDHLSVTGGWFFSYHFQEEICMRDFSIDLVWARL